MIVGIDVSKDKLDIYILPLAKHFMIKNTHTGIKNFMKAKLLKLGEPELIVFESTGGYEKLLEIYLLNEELNYHKAHPTRVHYFGKSKGYFAKTDHIDAQMLAHYGAQEEIEADTHRSCHQLKIQELSSRKQQIKDLISKEQPKLKMIYLEKTIKRSIKRSLSMFQRELELINKELKKLVAEDKTLLEKQELLQSVKGVGEEVSMLLVTDLPELGRLNRETISSLVGVAPQTKDSGKKQGYRSISRGRFHVRKGLYMAALVASRCNPRMKEIYQKLLSKGKKKKVALVAIMRKMLIMLNAMVRNQQPWQANRI